MRAPDALGERRRDYAPFPPAPTPAAYPVYGSRESRWAVEGRVLKLTHT